MATPYLRGYRAVAGRRGSLRGYWFLSPLRAAPEKLGFFVGYLTDSRELACLNPAPPECLVLVCVEPPGGALHRRLVSQPESLLRKTFDYIRWLTHRPPRFVLNTEERAVMLRHQSMRDWPPGKFKHYSRNFFIETLAWLVRSGLVKRLLVEPRWASRRAGKAPAGSSQFGKTPVNNRRRGSKRDVLRKARSR